MVLHAVERPVEAVTRALRDEIAQGSLAPGDRLPSERELGRTLGYSRQTVRRALAELVAAGRVTVRRGQGTYVAAPPVSEPPGALTSFSAMGRARGLTPGASVLNAATEPATIEDSELFGIAPGAPVLVLERLRTLDGLPVSVDLSRVPLARAPGLADVDFTVASLYAELDAAGHGPVRADYTVHAVAADARLARLLGVRAGSPVLLTDTTSRDAGGAVVERGRMAYRGDRYRFQATLSRPAAADA